MPPDSARANGTGCLVGPFELDPVARSTMAWIDRDHPERGAQYISTTGDYEIRPRFPLDIVPVCGVRTMPATWGQVKALYR